jgi:ketosteroid isomerase-like protein
VIPREVPVRLLIITILFITFFSPPQTVWSQSATDSIAAVQVLAVLQLQADAWNRGDIEGYMQGYWNSDSLVFTSGGNIRRGWQATLEKYKKSYSTKAQMGMLKFSRIEVTLLSPSSALVLGHWELQREKDHPGGVFSLILRKFSDGWKVIHDHTSKE